MGKKPSQVEQVPSRIMNRKEIERGIAKLEKRIGELKQLLTVHVRSELQLQCNEMVKVIDDSLASVFGRGTPEYSNYKIEHLYPGIIVTRSNEREHVDGYHRAILNGISTLSAGVKVLGERLDELDEDDLGSALRAYENLELHREIDRAAG